MDMYPSSFGISQYEPLVSIKPSTAPLLSAEIVLPCSFPPVRGAAYFLLNDFHRNWLLVLLNQVNTLSCAIALIRQMTASVFSPGEVMYGTR